MLRELQTGDLKTSVIPFPSKERRTGFEPTTPSLGSSPGALERTHGVLGGRVRPGVCAAPQGSEIPHEGRLRRRLRPGSRAPCPRSHEEAPESPAGQPFYRGMGSWPSGSPAVEPQDGAPRRSQVYIPERRSTTVCASGGPDVYSCSARSSMSPRTPRALPRMQPCSRPRTA